MTFLIRLCVLNTNVLLAVPPEILKLKELRGETGNTDCE